MLWLTFAVSTRTTGGIGQLLLDFSCPAGDEGSDGETVEACVEGDFFDQPFTPVGQIRLSKYAPGVLSCQSTGTGAGSFRCMMFPAIHVAAAIRLNRAAIVLEWNCTR